MQRSEQRILITHVGSLPRPAPLRDLLVRQDRGQSIDTAALEREIDACPGQKHHRPSVPVKNVIGVAIVDPRTALARTSGSRCRRC